MESLLINRFEQALLALDRLAIKSLLKQLRKKWEAIQCIEKVVVPALERISEGWKKGEIALSQIYMCGRICEESIDEILPAGDPERKDQPKMAIAVLEDYHFLGKRIVYTALRASGFELSDYGRTTVDELVDRVNKEGIRILLISVLMLPSALLVKNVVTKLNQSGNSVKVVVGGAPFYFDEELWKEVKADAMGSKASEAVRIVTNIMEEL